MHNNNKDSKVAHGTIIEFSSILIVIVTNMCQYFLINYPTNGSGPQLVLYPPHHWTLTRYLLLFLCLYCAVFLFALAFANNCISTLSQIHVIEFISNGFYP